MINIKLKPLGADKMRIEMIRMWCNKDNHDKIYGLYYNTETRQLLSVWGRRGSRLSSTVKTMKSILDFDKIKISKLNKGYVAVSAGTVEADIVLSLDEVANGIDGFQGILRSTVDKIESKIKSTFENMSIDEEVECVSIEGVDGFEEGVTYLFKGVVNDSLILVEDMEGEIQMVLADRFDCLSVVNGS